MVFDFINFVNFYLKEIDVVEKSKKLGKHAKIIFQRSKQKLESVKKPNLCCTNLRSRREHFKILENFKMKQIWKIYPQVKKNSRNLESRSFFQRNDSNLSKKIMSNPKNVGRVIWTQMFFCFNLTLIDFD